MIVCLVTPPSEILLAELYSVTHRLEPFEAGVYLEIDAQAAELVKDRYACAYGAGPSKEEARLRSLAPDLSDIDTLALDVLLSLGLSTAKLDSLTWLGVKTLGQLKAWRKTQLQAFLGDEAKRLLPYLKGPYSTNVALYTPPPYLSANYSFDEPALEPYLIWPVLEHLCLRAAPKPQQAALRLDLSAVSGGLAFSASTLSKEPITAKNLFSLAQQTLNKTGVLGLEIESLELSLKQLFRPSEQPSLWQRKAQVQKAVDNVERRFPGALLKIVEADPHSILSEFRFCLESVKGVTRGASYQEHYRLERPTQNGRRSDRAEHLRQLQSLA